MYAIGCAIIFCVNLLEKLSWLIADLFYVPIREVLPRFHFRCLNQSYNKLRIAGQNEWNGMVLEILMRRYGHGAQR